LLHVALLAPKILRWLLLDFWEMCATLEYGDAGEEYAPINNYTIQCSVPFLCMISTSTTMVTLVKPGLDGAWLGSFYVIIDVIDKE
jgi:hypothetical protein